MVVTNLIEEYFDYQKKYQEKYGYQTIVLMQVGSFHEAYQTMDKGFDLHKIGDILNIIVSKRNKSISTVDLKNPYMMGFPSISLQKFLKILVDNSFTVVIIDQVTPPPHPKREITGIYSVGTYYNEISNPDSNNIISIYIEECSSKPPMFAIGASIIDITTGKTMVYESYSEKMDENIALDDITKIIQSYSGKEYIININNVTSISQDKLISYLELNNKIYHISKNKNNIQSNKYQIELFKTVYGQKINNSTNIIEDINLDRLIYGRLSLVILLNYIYEHNKYLIQNLNIPEVIEKNDYMYLGNNAIYQLNIFNNDTTNISNIFSQNVQYKSLFDIINKTSTAMGRRFLKDNLVSPLISVPQIEQRYNIIDKFIENDYWKEVENMLNIPDIERFIRKISILQIHPLELLNCINGLKSSLNLIININLKINTDILSYPTKKIIREIQNMINIFDDSLNYDELSKYLLNDITGPIFRTGKFKDIDAIIEEINESNDYINSICKVFNNIVNKHSAKNIKCLLNGNNPESNEGSDNENMVTVEHSDNDGYYLSLTKRRSEIIQQYLEKNKSIKIGSIILSKEDIEFRSLKKGNTCKIFIFEIIKKSDIIISLTNDLKNAIKEKYIKWLEIIYKDFHGIFKLLVEYVSIIDFCKSGAKCAIKNKYIRPNIKLNNNKSYIDAKNMRHPICEKLLIDTEYVPINVKLGIDNEDGILLFGLNSAGKSTLQKSIGINIVLAQIGYFVAATQFNYYPYKSLMTRITSNDNLFKGLSSFALEISDLRAILKRSNENTLIIADEVCKGTEHQSSLIIVMTMLEILSKNKCSFITATHLHDITKLERLKQLSNIKLFHLHVEYDEQKNSLKYGRQLLEGSGEHFYGLNVAKYLINDNQFLTIANEIKLVICPDLLVGNKTSKYNSNVFINKCQICNYYPKNEYDKPLETHHINFQKNTDKNGFLLEKPHVHKNHKNNLCVLCFKCHDKIDTNEIVIYGYENNILQYKQCKQYKIESTTNKKNNTDFKMTIQILKDLKDKLSYIFQKYECKQLNILKDTFEKCI